MSEKTINMAEREFTKGRRIEATTKTLVAGEIVDEVVDIVFDSTEMRDRAMILAEAHPWLVQRYAEAFSQHGMRLGFDLGRRGSAPTVTWFTVGVCGMWILVGIALASIGWWIAGVVS